MSDLQTTISLFDQFLVAAGTFGAIHTISPFFISSMVSLNMYVETIVNRRIDKQHFERADAFHKTIKPILKPGY